MSRTLTVSTLFRDPRGRFSRPARVPHIRLTGQWLAAAGFPPGSRIAVRIAEGQLVITTQP